MREWMDEGRKGDLGWISEKGGGMTVKTE